MYVPEVHNFVIQQGQDWQKRLAWKTATGTIRNLSTYSGRMVLTPYLGFKGTIPSGYNIGGADSALTSGTELTLSASTGTPARNILIAVTDTVTAALDFERGQYTLEIVSAGGTIYRILQGFIYLSRETTN